MNNQLSKQERESTLSLPADERYDYFVDKVVAEGQVWSLDSPEGWVTVSSEDGEECLPVWPHADYAAEWATGEWADCRPAAIALDTWLTRWTAGMERDGSMVAVFPREDEEGVVVSPAELRDSLEAALAGNS